MVLVVVPLLVLLLLLVLVPLLLPMVLVASQALAPCLGHREIVTEMQVDHRDVAVRRQVQPLKLLALIQQPIACTPGPACARTSHPALHSCPAGARDGSSHSTSQARGTAAPGNAQAAGGAGACATCLPGFC